MSIFKKTTAFAISFFIGTLLPFSFVFAIDPIGSCLCTSKDTNCVSITLPADKDSEAGCKEMCLSKLTADTFSSSDYGKGTEGDAKKFKCNAASEAFTKSKTSKPTTPPKAFIKPTLNVDIPYVNFSDPVIQGENIKSSFLSDYLTGIYKFLMVASITIAIVMVMVGGLIYVLGAGKAELVAKGKTRMINATVGLVLLLSVYLILYSANPQLTILKTITLKNIPKVEWEEGSGGDTEDGDPGGDYSPPKDIVCPKNGGAAMIPKIVSSLQNRVVYRWGGKHFWWPGHPSGYAYPESNEKLLKYRNFCPNGFMCLDCSGYVNFVLMCAGLKQGGGSAGLLGKSKLLNTNDNPIDYAKGIVNGKPLQPGDVIGWTSGDKLGDGPKPRVGHVLLYAGTVNGSTNQLSESSGCFPCRGLDTPQHGSLKVRSFAAYSSYFPKKNDGSSMRWYRIRRQDGGLE